MCNPREERDAGLMLMELSEIPSDILDGLEQQYQQELDSRNKNEWITGMLKMQYVALKVIQTIKRVHRELDESRGC